MIYQTVGSVLSFPQVFYDADGNVTTVTTATLTIVYPTSTMSGALLWRDPGSLKQVATIPMVLQSDGFTYLANWDSSVANPGQVTWSISSTPAASRITSEGTFVLRGNIATMQSFPPTAPVMP